MEKGNFKATSRVTPSANGPFLINRIKPNFPGVGITTTVNVVMLLKFRLWSAFRLCAAWLKVSILWQQRLKFYFLTAKIPPNNSNTPLPNVTRSHCKSILVKNWVKVTKNKVQTIKNSKKVAKLFLLCVLEHAASRGSLGNPNQEAEGSESFNTQLFASHKIEEQSRVIARRLKKTPKRFCYCTANTHLLQTTLLSHIRTTNTWTHRHTDTHILPVAFQSLWSLNSKCTAFTSSLWIQTKAGHQKH